MSRDLSNTQVWCGGSRDSGSIYEAYRDYRDLGLIWVLPPLSNSWIMKITWLYNIALNRTPNIDCSWVGAVPKV